MSVLSLFKSWWVWDGLENSDLWYNCRFDNFTGTWLCASSKESGKQPFHYFRPPRTSLYMNSSLRKGQTWELWWLFFEDMVMFPQSGSRQCRSSWFCQWSSLPSPSWCSWVSSSPCQREDSSISPGCVKSLQVTVEWNNVLLICVYTMRTFGKADARSDKTEDGGNWILSG